MHARTANKAKVMSGRTGCKRPGRYLTRNCCCRVCCEVSRPLGLHLATGGEHLGRAAVLAGFGATSSPTNGQSLDTMYGLIGKIEVAPGQRAALTAVLLQGMADMPGCQSYVVAEDPDDADALWVTEVWDSRESHAASLSLPSVQDAIREGRPMIAAFSQRTETNVLGGHGLG